MSFVEEEEPFWAFSRGILLLELSLPVAELLPLVEVMEDELELSLEYANRAILLDKTSSYSYFRKAWALQEMEKYGEAITSYEKCIEYESTFVDAYANISFCYSKLKDFNKSILVFAFFEGGKHSL